MLLCCEIKTLRYMEKKILGFTEEITTCDCCGKADLKGTYAIDYKCALTGDTICFTDNIELDHILPTTRNGENDLLNVRWVTKEANRLKQNLTDTELKTLCKKILKTI